MKRKEEGRRQKGRKGERASGLRVGEDAICRSVVQSTSPRHRLRRSGQLPPTQAASLPRASRFQNLLLACPAIAARSSFTFSVRWTEKSTRPKSRGETERKRNKDGAKGSFFARQRSGARSLSFLTTPYARAVEQLPLQTGSQGRSRNDRGASRKYRESRINLTNNVCQMGRGLFVSRVNNML